LHFVLTMSLAFIFIASLLERHDSIFRITYDVINRNVHVHVHGTICAIDAALDVPVIFF